MWEITSSLRWLVKCREKSTAAVLVSYLASHFNRPTKRDIADLASPAVFDPWNAM
jgi:hypothetical protein